MRLDQRWKAAFVAAMVLTSCKGGDGGSSGPAAVSNVVVSIPATQLEMGSTIAASAVAKDRAGAVVSGKSFTWNSSAQTVATITSAGIINGVAPGRVTITATVDGVSGSANLDVIAPAVASVAVTPQAPSIRQGESIQLSAALLDAIGRPLTGRSLAWTSRNPAIATVSNLGLVSALAAGSVFIVASSEGKLDSTAIRIKGLNAPTIVSTAPSQWTPGISAQITGTNFSPTVSNNEVFLNGAPIVVTAATPTTLTVTVPQAIQLPCSATGPVPLIVAVNGDSVQSSAALRVATARTLQVGQSLVLTGQTDLACNEFAATGGRYLVTAFNASTSSTSRASFQLLGLATSSATLQGSFLEAPSQVLSGSRSGRDLARRISPSAHMRILQENEAQFAAHPTLLRDLRTRRNSRPKETSTSGRVAGASRAIVPNPPPAVGDRITRRMRRNFNSLSTFDEVPMRVVYVGPKIIMLEDETNPLAGQTDGEYQALGQEFDTDMFRFLSNFGDPLALDSLTDNNGRVIAVFSHRVNEYDVGGGAGGLLGFVTICDFFARTDPDPNNVCPTSNEGEYFYAIAPKPGSDRTSYSVESWKRFVRGTLVHEMKHVVMLVERIAREATVTEETWLEEATAQLASEMWARNKYGFGQRANITWLQGPRCDYATTGATCPDPFEGILHHMQFLYDFAEANEASSLINNQSSVIYGVSWLMARWATDHFDGGNESAFLQSLVQQKNDRGIVNLTARTGRTWSELMAEFSMAATADDYPGATIANAHYQIPSWNTRDIFAGMSDNLVFSGNIPAFPLRWPYRVRAANFGNFSEATRSVAGLPGGSFAAWDISGTQLAPQVLAIRNTLGGLAPGNVGMVVLRVQ